MVISPDRLEQLHLARLESRLRPFEGLIEQIESQIDHDLRGGWGDVDEHTLDPADPRRVRLEFTTELDLGVEEEIAALEPGERALVEREVRRRYLTAGYRSLTFLDDGRVRLEHVIGPAADRQGSEQEGGQRPGQEVGPGPGRAAGPGRGREADPGHGANGAVEGG